MSPETEPPKPDVPTPNGRAPDTMDLKPDRLNPPEGNKPTLLQPGEKPDAAAAERLTLDTRAQGQTVVADAWATLDHSPRLAA